ncbi:MAG: SBBP repeat-containing protein [Acidobacteria bacterium]|nr:SBBP repeat-containing protein [Acidobacteriota bacterium]
MKSLGLSCALLMLAVTLFAGNVQYSYDAAGRLIKVDYGDGRSIAYTYDAAGNLLKREQTGSAGAASAASVPALSFEANQGQIDSRYQVRARRGDYSVALSAQEALFALPGAALRLEWIGANPAARSVGQQPQASTTNYLTGSDASKWRTGVPRFARIQYQDLFPGVDIVYYGNPQQLEYDLIVHPGADPAKIRFRLPGASQTNLAPNGDLVLEAGGQTALFHKPVLHQIKNGTKRPVTGSYDLAGGTIGFRVGTYDRSLPLIIDPVFGDFTLAGGSGDDVPTAAAEDAFGFLYVVGTTNSTDLPGLVRPVQGSNAGSTDVFVMKLSQNTKALVWVTYLGGLGADTGGGISVDRQGIVTLSGTTASQNFPVTGDALQRTFGGGATDGFVARLNARGERLLYSTYLGGSAADATTAVAVDATGIIYAAGTTASTNFLTRPGAFQDKHNGATDGFLMKLNPGDAVPVYATLLGGTAADGIQGLAIDSTGSAYVAGTTASANFPTTSGVLGTALVGGTDAFVTKVNPTGTALLYSTYYGGGADDQALSLALNPAGSALVSGVTTSRNLPMGGSVLNRQYLGGPSDGFFFQLSPNGNQLQASSYLGGNGEDSADAIAVRVEGTILVAVNGTSFPGEPARMYAYSGDLSRELGNQTFSSACTSGGARMIALTHSANRSRAIGWLQAGGDCRAPQLLASPDARDSKTEPQRQASVERFNGGGKKACFGDSLSGSPPSGGPPAGFSPQPVRQFKASGMSGDPFSTATGEHTDEFEDLRLAGIIGLQFRRYYSSVLSGNEINSGLGVNWAHNFDLSLTVTADQATVNLEGGSKVAFRLVSGTWQMQPQQQSDYRLLESPNDYRLGDIANGRILTFNRRGQLTRLEDRNGNALQVTPAAAGPAEVADGFGRSLRFTYANGFLSEVRDHSGRIVRFGYRGENLVSVTDVLGRVTRYEYGASGRLTRHILPTGTPTYTNTYDPTGRVTEQLGPEGQVTKVAYESPTVTAVTDPLNAVTRFTHSAGGDLTRLTDPTGSVIEMTYDPAHRLISRRDRLGNVPTFTYHAPTGRLQTETDALGNRTAYTYTAQVQGIFTFFNVTKVELPDGTTVSYEYDPRGNPITVTDRSGRLWRLTYNAQGLALTLTSPTNAVASWRHAANGDLISATGYSGDVVTYERDALGRLTKLTKPDGATRLFTYDLASQVTQETDENGKTTQYAYDVNQQLTAFTDELGATESLSYNLNRLPGQATDRLGNKFAFAYNRNNLAVRITDPNGSQVDFSYDPLHSLTAVRDSIGLQAQYSYDKESAPITQTDALNRVWKMENDKLGRPVKLTTPLGSTASQTWDAAGRLASSTNGLEQKATFSYDPAGRLTALEGPGGLKTALAYDPFGSPTAVTDAGGARWSRTYDQAGRLLTVTDPLNRSFSYAYDKADRLAAVKLPQDLGASTLSYDPAGRLASTRTSDGSEVPMTRDAKGRVVASTGLTLAFDADDNIIASNGITNTRDALGRIATVTLAPEKTIQYTYNARDQVTKVTDWLGAVTELSYDASGALKEIKRPNQVVSTFSYDGDARLASIEESRDSLLSRLSFTYDAASRVIAEERSLPSLPATAPALEEFTYDVASQRNGATYDAAGRVVSDPLRNYSWDVESRLVGFTSADSNVALSYDALGELNSRSQNGVTTSFVVNHAFATRVLAVERSAEADLRYYVHLPNGYLLYSIDAASNARRFYHFDRLGSTTFLTAEDGTVTDTYDITPYGETVAQQGTTDNPYTFLGAFGVRQQDRAGLFLMKLRLYDATTARFLSRDSVLDPSPRAVNPYQYGLANPVSYSDPNGQWNIIGAIVNFFFPPKQDPPSPPAAPKKKKPKAPVTKPPTGSCDLSASCMLKPPPRPQLSLPGQNPVGLQPTLGKPTVRLTPRYIDAASGVDLGAISKLNVWDRSTLIGLDGSTLKGLELAGLIGNDGSTLIGNDGSTYNFTPKALSLIGNDGSTLIGNDGSTLVNYVKSFLIGLDGSTLASIRIASIIGLDSSSLISNRGSSLIGNAGGALIGNAGGALIGNAGGAVISTDGAGFKRFQRLRINSRNENENSNYSLRSGHFWGLLPRRPNGCPPRQPFPTNPGRRAKARPQPSTLRPTVRQLRLPLHPRW